MEIRRSLDSLNKDIQVFFAEPFGGPRLVLEGTTRRRSLNAALIDGSLRMLENIWIFGSAFFVLAASCYLLFITSDPLEKVGGRIGRLLRLPEDVIASTFQAAATSGPEIALAIVAATTFIARSGWEQLELGEKSCSGCLNMCFSAMDNLLGIGCLGLIYMMMKKTASRDEVIIIPTSGRIGLIFYIVSSTCLSLFIMDSLITETEAWVLMTIGMMFIVSQFFIPGILNRLNGSTVQVNHAESGDGSGDEEDEEDEAPIPTSVAGWLRDLASNGCIYLFLVFAMVIFVRQCLGATFNMATIGIVSVGGVLIMFTSYVSSFPEFMMTYRYAKAVKKGALLGMLFGSNVIDLSFAGFRAMWLHEPMAVYTTGRFPWLLPVYVWALPTVAVISLIGLWAGKVKFKHAYPLMVLYLVYIVSGFVLL
jgi:Ca2+/Na+ antiporter